MEISQQYNSVPVIARCLHLPPYFHARSIRWRHLNFSPANPCCHGNEFWDKIDYNSAPMKIAPCLHIPPIYAATRLYSVAMGQIPRTTERISSFSNVFYICGLMFWYTCWPGPELVLSQSMVNFNVINVGEISTKPLHITNVSDADSFYQVSSTQQICIQGAAKSIL